MAQILHLLTHGHGFSFHDFFKKKKARKHGFLLLGIALQKWNFLISEARLASIMSRRRREISDNLISGVRIGMCEQHV